MKLDISNLTPQKGPNKNRVMCASVEVNQHGELCGVPGNLRKLGVSLEEDKIEKKPPLNMLGRGCRFLFACKVDVFLNKIGGFPDRRISFNLGCPIIYRVHPRWCRISSINRSSMISSMISSTLLLYELLLGPFTPLSLFLGPDEKLPRMRSIQPDPGCPWVRIYPPRFFLD